jgi:tRNA modification GTPase
MLYDLRDTIVAVASAPGGAARGIVRLSGPEVVRLITATFHSSGLDATAEPKRSAVHRGTLRLADCQRDLPALLYLWPGTRSYTREPTAELHTIGSPPLLAAAVEELCRHGARPAAPGEFTLRAFVAGRIDLTQAEAVLGVIDAQGEQQLKAALAQMAGGLAAPLSALRESLLDLLARLEAGLDFVGEDIAFISAEEIATELAAALHQVEQLTARIGSRGESADLVRVVLVGLPNAGKSSLFNALAGAEALVSDQPGTTRDYLTARLDFAGVACELVDTAGIQSGGDALAPQAQQQTHAQAERAQITLLCIDASDPLGLPLPAPPASGSQIVVLTKYDLPKNNAPAALDVPGAIEVSVRTGHGLEALGTRIGMLAAAAAGGDRVAVSSTAVRAAHSVRSASEALERAHQLNEQQAGDELVAAELHVALDELGKVSGAVTTDDVLDRIFSRFCIGK